MTRILAVLIIALAVALSPFVSSAIAESFVIVGDTVAGFPVFFDGSAFIHSPGCSYAWTWSFVSGNSTIIGDQMGHSPVVVYVFDAFAASKPCVTVSLVISQGRFSPRRTYHQTFTVRDSSYRGRWAVSGLQNQT